MLTRDKVIFKRLIKIMFPFSKGELLKYAAQRINEFFRKLDTAIHVFGSL